MKLNLHTFRWKSFLPLSLVFYPTFSHLKITANQIWACKLPNFKAKMWGKKLVRGVKNFFIWKYEYSTSICTKNHYHIFKIRENRTHQSWEFLIKKMGSLPSRLFLTASFNLQYIMSQKGFVSLILGLNLPYEAIWKPIDLQPNHRAILLSLYLSPRFP